MLASDTPLNDTPLAAIENVYIRILQVQSYDMVPSVWKLQNVRDSFWRLYRNERDGASLEVAGQQVPLQARQLYFIPAGVRFSASTVREMNQFYVHFDVAGLPDFVARGLFNAPIALQTAPSLQSSIASIARRMEKGEMPDLAMHLQIKAVFYDGLAKYLGQLPPERIEQYRGRMHALTPVLPAIAHMEKNLAVSLSNRELAGCCHMSESHFIRSFHACVSQTPKQYLLERRVQIAAQQLLYSGQSIDQIAAETGFGNRFYFSRAFKRKTGSSPAAYRNSPRY